MHFLTPYRPSSQGGGVCAYASACVWERVSEKGCACLVSHAQQNHSWGSLGIMQTPEKNKGGKWGEREGAGERKGGTGNMCAGERAYRSTHKHHNPIGMMNLVFFVLYSLKTRKRACRHVEGRQHIETHAIGKRHACKPQETKSETNAALHGLEVCAREQTRSK